MTTSALVDPHLITLVERERLLCNAIRDDRLAGLASMLSVLDEPETATSRSDPLIDLAGLAIAAAAGATVPADYVVQCWQAMRGGSRSVAAAALAALTLPCAVGTPDAAVVTDLIDDLLPTTGGMVVITGAAFLGPSDSHLGALFDMLGDTKRAEWHHDKASSLTARFAPSWSQFVRSNRTEGDSKR